MCVMRFQTRRRRRHKIASFVDLGPFHKAYVEMRSVNFHGDLNTYNTRHDGSYVRVMLHTLFKRGSSGRCHAAYLVPSCP